MIHAVSIIITIPFFSLIKIYLMINTERSTDKEVQVKRNALDVPILSVVSASAVLPPL
jgi:hypothetical protein